MAAWPVTGTLLLFREMPVVFQPPYRAAVIGRTGRGDYGHGLDVAMLGQPNLTVVAVADDDPKGLAAAAKRLGVDRAYADYRAMLDREKPQFVAVAPRWVDCHEAMILDCAERGIHVFSEKPLAPDLAQADAIVSACERSHVKLAIAFQSRYGPRYERVRELIGSGAIGEVLELRGRGKEDHRGGGEDLMVLGPHIMDLIRGLLGDASWCFARVTDGGKPITRASVRPGAEGLGPLAGDRIDAVYGFKDTPVVAHFATVATGGQGGAQPPVRVADLRLQGGDRDRAPAGSLPPSCWPNPPGARRPRARAGSRSPAPARGSPNP